MITYNHTQSIALYRTHMCACVLNTNKKTRSHTQIDDTETMAPYNATRTVATNAKAIVTNDERTRACASDQSVNNLYHYASELMCNILRNLIRMGVILGVFRIYVPNICNSLQRACPLTIDMCSRGADANAKQLRERLRSADFITAQRATDTHKRNTQMRIRRTNADVQCARRDTTRNGLM